MQRDQYAVAATAGRAALERARVALRKGSIQRYDLVVLTVLIGEIVLLLAGRG